MRSAAAIGQGGVGTQRVALLSARRSAASAPGVADGGACEVGLDVAVYDATAHQDTLRRTRIATSPTPLDTRP